MSLTIDKKKLKFSVFGNGFEDERADSGEGNDTEGKFLSYSPNSFAIDSTGTYYWFWNFYSGMQKRLLSDGSSVTQPISISTTSALVHPMNVSNDYGILITSGGYNLVRFIVFNLSDDSIYLDVTCSGSGFSEYGNTAILVGTDIYITYSALRARIGFYLAHIDLDAGTATINNISGNENACGFVDSDTIYCSYIPEWFDQHKRAMGKTLGLANQWSLSALVAGGSGFPYVDYTRMMCGGKGYIYCPVYKNSAWRLGEFDGNHTPNFETPKPLRIFGKFKQFPQIRGWCFNQGSTKASFMTDLGLFATDFKDIELISTAISFGIYDYTEWCPMEMCDDYIVVTNHSSGHYIFTI